MTIVALVTSTLTLASFVKVTQSVFFGQLPKECENAKEVPFGMRFAMGILALLCVVTGLFPKRGEPTSPEAPPPAPLPCLRLHQRHDGRRLCPVRHGRQRPGGPAPSATEIVGVWQPVNWLMLLMIALLSICIVAIACKYDPVHGNKEREGSPQVPPLLRRRGTVFSQVGGGDLFWGFKHNWRHYFSFMHDLHSGIVNDYSLWAVVALALAMVYALIVL